MTNGQPGRHHFLSSEIDALEHEAKGGTSRSKFLFFLRLFCGHGFSSYFHCGEFSKLKNQPLCMRFLYKPFFFMETALPSCLLFLTVVCQTGAFCPENVNRLYKAAEHPGNPEDL